MNKYQEALLMSVEEYVTYHHNMDMISSIGILIILFASLVFWFINKKK